MTISSRRSRRPSRKVVGDPFDPATQMGPLAMERQRDRVEGYIAKGKEEGATLATGGGRPAHLNRGYFIEPTVFGNVDNRLTIAREEIFGPVLSVIPADSEEQAIEIANDTIYGLNSLGVHQRSGPRLCRRPARSAPAPSATTSGRPTSRSAFGGFKQSGIGREGGIEGLHPYLEAKTMIFEGSPPLPVLPKHARRISGL